MTKRNTVSLPAGERITSPVPLRPSLTARYQALHAAVEHVQAARPRPDAEAP
jgi:hypothetical protein